MFFPSSPSRIWLLLVLVIASFGILAKGQTISGTIAGTILDQQGGILSGVGVTATNTETGLTYEGVTDTQRGMFVIPEVPPGLYRVRAQFSGFQTEEHHPVRVDVNRVTEEDFALKISTSSTVVVVQSTAPMTDINTATLGANFNQMQIRELPILSRDINNLALLAPGVQSVRTFSFASTLVPFSVNGSGGRYNNFIIDSVGNNEPIFGGAATQFSNPDIFSDYAILTSAPKAEFGRDTGSTVNVITKSGSNKLHGTAFWFGDWDHFNAMNNADAAALLTSPPPYYEHKVGGTLGGPLGKKDTFFFLSYQYDRARTDLSNVFPVIATLPTSAGLTALKASSSPSVASMLAYPSVGSIPGGGGNCIGGSPNPCFPPVSVGAYQFATYDVPQGNLFDVYDHQASARIDRRINNSNDIYGRFLVDDLRTPQGVLAPAAQVAYNDLGSLPDSQESLHQRTQSAMLDERYARSNSLNEIRFSFSRIAQVIGAFNLPSTLLNNRPATTVADLFGGFGQYQSNFPSAGSQFTLGQDTSSTVNHTNVFQATENFSLTRSKHSVKMGVDFVRTQSNIIDVPSDLGHYFFGAPAIPGGLNSFATEPTSGSTNAFAVLKSFPNLQTSSTGAITGQGANELPLRETDIATFIQDDFRVRPNFTLSYGVRWERFGQPINGMMKLNPSPGLALPTSSGNFGPRFGLAWSPGSSHKTVIRGGYSLMYSQMPLNLPLLMWQSAPISPTIATITPSGAQHIGLGSVSLLLPTASVYPNAALSIQSINIGVQGCGSQLNAGRFPLQLAPGSVPLIRCSTQNTVSPTLSSPYVQNWSLGIQRELGRNMMFEVNYVGTKGTDLYSRQDLNYNNGWNATCLESTIGPACLNPRARDANRGDITAVANAGLSTYHSLQASVSTRTLHVQGNSLTFTAAYTWSHMIDLASEVFGPGVRVIQQNNILDGLYANPNALASVEAATPFPQDPTNLRAERGNSSYDRRHRFVFSEIWGLPTPTYWRPARAILGGWNLNGIGTLQSGQPFTPLNGVPTGICADANGNGQLNNVRPDIGNPNAPVNSVALIDDITCRSTSAATQQARNDQYPGFPSTTGYIAVDGTPISPSAAHFVQIPVGSSLAGGNAGRNILIGPGLVNFDFALFKQFRWGEGRMLEFRWEVYDVFNHLNYGNPLGNVFTANAQPSPGYAFSQHASVAGITGATPENTIDATTGNNIYDFLSRANMNSGNRSMQFGVHLTF